jgi:hypothetical protein
MEIRAVDVIKYQRDIPEFTWRNREKHKWLDHDLTRKHFE